MDSEGWLAFAPVMQGHAGVRQDDPRTAAWEVEYLRCFGVDSVLFPTQAQAYANVTTYVTAGRSPTLELTPS